MSDSTQTGGTVEWDGCWAAYASDYIPYLISVHPTEVEALRAAVDYGAGGVVPLPWGMALADAIKAADSKIRIPDA